MNIYIHTRWFCRLQRIAYRNFSFEEESSPIRQVTWTKPHLYRPYCYLGTNTVDHENSSIFHQQGAQQYLLIVGDTLKIVRELYHLPASKRTKRLVPLLSAAGSMTDSCISFSLHPDVCACRCWARLFRLLFLPEWAPQPIQLISEKTQEHDRLL